MPLSPPNYRKTAYTHREGLRADQPLATDVLEGTLYFVTDEGIIERSDGSNWNTYSGISNWVDIASDPSNYTARPTMTFTLTTQETLSYVQIGRTIILSWSYVGTIGGTVNQELRVMLPHTIINRSTYTMGFIMDGALVTEVANIFAGIGTNYIGIYRTDFSNFVLGTEYSWGQVCYEI